MWNKVKETLLLVVVHTLTMVAALAVVIVFKIKYPNGITLEEV